jgi:hypothetical protein
VRGVVALTAADVAAVARWRVPAPAAWTAGRRQALAAGWCAVRTIATMGWPHAPTVAATARCSVACAEAVDRLGHRSTKRYH